MVHAASMPAPGTRRGCTAPASHLVPPAHFGTDPRQGQAHSLGQRHSRCHQAALMYFCNIATLSLMMPRRSQS